MLLAAAGVSLIFHWRIFHLDLLGQHVWRQTQTQLNIRNFSEGSLNILNPRINQIDLGTTVHRMEFPLMQWCIAIVDRIFGYSIFITRLMMFLIGILAMAGAGFFAKNIFSHKYAPAIFIWAFTFSPLFYYYTLNPLPDVAALGLTLWGCGFFFSWWKTEIKRHLVFTGILFALGALLKLPFIIYFILIPLAVFFRRNRGTKYISGSLARGMTWIIFPLAWYSWVIPQWTNNPVVSGILDADNKQVQGLLNYLWGNFSSTLPEILINYAAVPLFLAGCWFIGKNKLFREKTFVLVCTLSLLILAYFIFELNLIAVNHDYYLFPFLPMIFLIVTYGATQLLKVKPGNYFVIFCLWACPFAAYLRMDNRWDIQKPGFNKELLFQAENLKKIIPENDSIITIGDQSANIWFYYLDRKGWSYNEPLNVDYIGDRIRDGAKIIITDSKSAGDTILAHAKQLNASGIMKIGSFQVISVK
jgi:hypothetical protein